MLEPILNTVGTELGFRSSLVFIGQQINGVTESPERKGMGTVINKEAQKHFWSTGPIVGFYLKD